MDSTMKRSSRKQRGSILPVVLAMSVGVGALSAGYSMRHLREQQRSDAYRYRGEALYEALGQLELTAYMINTSGYSETGQNLALARALERDDSQFVDPDGWPTGVTAIETSEDSGFYELVSESTVRDYTRAVSALVRERQSFADFNYFVSEHPLGISGGESGVFPYPDAPEGSIHSNDRIDFYFPDRHFRDPVTAVNGFGYLAGANGPEHVDGTNTFFHGATNNAAGRVEGLTNVDIGGMGGRADALLNLDGQWDYANVKLKRDEMWVEHRERSHWEDQEVTTETDVFVDEARTRMVPETALVNEPITVVVDEWSQVDVWVKEYENIYETRQRWVEDIDIFYKTVQETRTRTVTKQRWIEGGGGADTGGAGGSGAVGYWESYRVTETYTVDVQVEDYRVDNSRWEDYQKKVGRREIGGHWEKKWRVTGQHTEFEDNFVERATGNMVEEAYTESVFSHTDVTTSIQRVYVRDHRVAAHDLPTDGTVYVRGDIRFYPMRTSRRDPYDTHVLDGSVTFASGDDILLYDSIVYGKNDADGNLQTAYLNGGDRTKDYKPNADYEGRSVLGLIAYDDIEYRRNLPDQTEINATMMAKTGHVRVYRTGVRANGDAYTRGRGFVKMSLRRLGGLISNQRPISAYIDENNAVTHGFVFAKSIFDRRQLTTPPRGFPTINRPRVLALVLKEVN